MSEKATVLGSSTLGSFKEETVATPPVETPAPVETSNNAAVNSNGQLETKTQETIPTNTNVPPIEKPKEEEDNSAVFDFPKEETPQAVQEGQPQPQTISWKDAIKNIDKKEIAKELGFDDFDIEFSEQRKNGVDPYKIFEIRGIDYNKVPDEILAKESLKKEYPFLADDNEKIEKLFNNKYKQDALATDDEKELGQIQMRADAYKYRNAKIEEQKKFTFPEPKPQAAQPQVNQEEIEKQKKEQEKFVEAYRNHEATKSLTEGKRVALSLGEGLQPFNLKVENPEMVWNMLFNPEYAKKFARTKEGEPNVQLAYELALHQANPISYNRSLVNYGKALGKRELLEEGQNPKKPDSIVPAGSVNATEKDAWKNARSGTLGSN